MVTFPIFNNDVSMYLEEFIDFAGGEANISRVLTRDGQLSLALYEHSLVGNLPETIQLQQVNDEWHISVSRSVDMTDDALFRLGRTIENTLKSRARQYLKPTDSIYRPVWHISPPQGLLNDPNGFIFHDNTYHLCYQWYPFACMHKDKYWVQMHSDDLVNWTWKSIALTPSDWFDSHGVFSGHAVSLNPHELMVFYTGNTRLGEERYRQTTQCAAVSRDDGVHYTKLGPLIRELPLGVTEHIRDPKVVKHHDRWLMFLGAQTTELKGRLAIYESDDLHEWRFKGLYGDELGDFGYMWECPDIFCLGDTWWFMFSPQGIPSHSRHWSIPHHNRIASLSFDSDNNVVLSDPHILDHGFDFYAPQSMETPDGRRVLIGWMGLPDEINQPSCDEGWIHQFTAPRELYLEHGKIRQRPITELTTLRDRAFSLVLMNSGTDIETKSFELIAEIEWGTTLHLFSDGEHYLELRFDAEEKTLILDRTHTELREGDTIRTIALSEDSVKLHVLADHSSVELFINDGEFVMTSRVFTPGNATRINAENKPFMAQCYSLKTALLPFCE